MGPEDIEKTPDGVRMAIVYCLLVNGYYDK